MNASSWLLSDKIARLTNLKVAATIDLSKPENGLIFQLLGGAEPFVVRALGFRYGGSPSPSEFRMDAYVRDADLVATFEAGEQHELRVQAYWRRLSAGEFSAVGEERVLIAVELILSVNTSLLNFEPTVTVNSELSPIVEVQPICQPQEAGESAQQTMATADPFPCTGLVARLAGGNISYVELSPQDEIETGRAVGKELNRGTLRRSQKVFPRQLEKGVILRTRVRAALVERTDDEAIAVSALEQFAVAAPPLTA